MHNRLATSLLIWHTNTNDLHFKIMLWSFVKKWKEASRYKYNCYFLFEKHEEALLAADQRKKQNIAIK